MAKVYVWLPKKDDSQSLIGQFRAQVQGHSAMELKNGQYISFWPSKNFATSRDQKHKKANKKSFGIISSYHTYSDSYQEDRDHIKRDAEHPIIINNLEEEVISEFWKRLRIGCAEFHIIRRNCSTVVASAIQLGFEPDRFYSYVKRSKSSQDFLGYAPESIIYNSVDYLIRLKGLFDYRVPKEIGDIYSFYMERTFEVWTPKHVKNFAKAASKLNWS